MLTKNKIRIYLKELYTKSEEELEVLLTRQFNKKYHDNYHKSGSYHFFNNESPILLVAHLDTVHIKKPGTFYTIDGYTYSAENGIGADDRNGIVAIIELVDSCIVSGKHPPSVLFTCQEEVGGVGVREFVQDARMVELIRQKNVFLQFDRKGAREFVTYGYKNDDLFEKIKNCGFQHEHGSYTDVSTLMQKTGIMGVNFSAGFYKAHTKNEYTDFLELSSNITKVLKLLPELEKKQFIATEEVFNYTSSFYYAGYDQQTLFEEDAYEAPYVIDSGAELHEIIEDEALELVLESPHFIRDTAINELYSYYSEHVVNQIIRMIGSYTFNQISDERDDEYEFDI